MSGFFLGLFFSLSSAAFLPADSTYPLQSDTLMLANDSTPQKKKSSVAIESVMDYMARDSIYIDMKTNKSYLYMDGDVKYSGSVLTADYMEIDFKKEEVLALPVKDSIGEWTGIPHYEQGETFFDANEILYNFATKRGLIKNVKSAENEIYIHGQTVKKMEDGVTYVHKAQFTSCDLDHPHFDFRSYRAKMIPDDKIVVGVTMMHIMDVPTPLVLPFGIFPSTKGRRSGVLIPAIGQSARSGFFFRGLGFYWNINDYFDAKFDADLYTGGNWEVRAKFRYAKRYRFQGGLNVGYSINYSGERGQPNRPKSNGFMIEWVHSQDKKSNPNSDFRANVNFKNATYSEYTGSINDYLTNTTTSNITYSLRILNRMSLTVNGAAGYNTNDRSFEIVLPDLGFGVDQFYLFKRKKASGAKKWYESISFRYNTQLQNKINATDTNLFTQKTLDDMQNGMKHQIVLSSSNKIFKHISWNNSVNYNEYWYLKTSRKSWEDSALDTRSKKGFRATRDFSFNSNLNFRLYGMLRFKSDVVKAFRHVMTPSIGVTYRPDFSKPFWGNYQSYTDGSGQEQMYSIYQGTLFGGPPNGMVGSINFSLGNNFELKVRNKKDSVNPEKNISLLDYFTISTSYNIAADSLRWAPLLLNARTLLFKRLTVQAAASFDFYKVDSNGRRYNEFVWKNSNKKGLRFERTNLFLGLSWSFNPQTFGKEPSTPQTNDPTLNGAKAAADPLLNSTNVWDQPIYFDVPWNISLNYTLNYTLTPSFKTDSLMHQIVQTLGISGSFALTPKWQISFGTGFDFVTKKITVTTINFSRDLHCWDMGFYWVPFGGRSEWNFYIRVRSSVFQDIKYEKRKPHTDNF